MTTTIAKRQNGNLATSFGNVADHFLQNSLRRFFDDNFWEAGWPQSTGNVPVNVKEHEQHYEIDVIAPGFNREDFNVNIQDNLLTIACNHTQEKQDQDTKTGWVRNEYVQRSFSRTFTLDDSVDANKVNAAYNNGILRLTIPKNEKTKKTARTIEIK